MNRQKDYPLTASTWYNIKQRTSKNYDGYYAGVELHPRWQSFHNFVEDMGPRPSKKHELDRIDTAGNYEPGNCRWVTHAENMANVKGAVLYAGKTLGQWSRETGINRTTLYCRIRRGMSIEEALK